MLIVPGKIIFVNWGHGQTLPLKFLFYHSGCYNQIMLKQKNDSQNVTWIKKIFPILAATASLLVFFVSFSLGVNHTVSLFRPVVYYQSFHDFKQQQGLSASVSETDKDKDVVPATPMYTEQQLRAIYEEEKASRRERVTNESINGAIKSWIIAALSLVLLIYFKKQLKS